MQKEEKKKKVKVLITPNDKRVILRRLKFSEGFSKGGILIPGQMKGGESLFVGEIVKPGGTAFKKHQIVYYSEYSASTLFNIGSVIRGEQSYGELFRGDLYVVAEDDIMASEDPELRVSKKAEVDFGKVVGEAIQEKKKSDEKPVIVKP